MPVMRSGHLIWEYYILNSIGLNPVCGFIIWDFWRVWEAVRMKFSFGRQAWVRKGSTVSFSRFGPWFVSFLAEIF